MISVAIEPISNCISKTITCIYEDQFVDGAPGISDFFGFFLQFLLLFLRFLSHAPVHVFGTMSLNSCLENMLPVLAKLTFPKKRSKPVYEIKEIHIQL